MSNKIEIDWLVIFDLRCRSKRGEQLSDEQFKLLNEAHKQDPERYKAMNEDIFEATNLWPKF